MWNVDAVMEVWFVVVYPDAVDSMQHVAAVAHDYALQEIQFSLEGLLEQVADIWAAVGFNVVIYGDDWLLSASCDSVGYDISSGHDLWWGEHTDVAESFLPLGGKFHNSLVPVAVNLLGT